MSMRSDLQNFIHFTHWSLIFHVQRIGQQALALSSVETLFPSKTFSSCCFVVFQFSRSPSVPTFVEVNQEYFYSMFHVCSLYFLKQQEEITFYNPIKFLSVMIFHLYVKK